MKTVTVTPIIECLLQGRERIRNGWCQKAFEEDGKVCAMQALAMCATTHQLDYVVWLVSAKLARALPEGWGENVISYNDAAGRTQEDILALYDRAIQMELDGQA